MMRIMLLLLALLCSTTPSFSADKYALLIGVTQYQKSQMNDPPLSFPEADAAAVGSLLKANGYTVKTLLGKQATQAAVEQELQVFEQQGSEGGVVLIGLFGHGVQYGSDAYFCPWNTTLRQVQDSVGNTTGKLEPDPSSMTTMKRLLDALNLAGASNRVLLADCCRNDPSAARGGLNDRAFGSQLKSSDLPPGTAAVFSCSSGEKAFEHADWGHGAFTKAFLDHFSAGGLARDASVTSMLFPLSKRVNSLVSAKSPEKSQQINPILNGIVDLQLEIKPAGVAEMRRNPEMQPRVSADVPSAGGLEFVRIPAGKFVMGSPPGEPDRSSDEGPQHEVTISKDYFAGKHEVTVGQILHWLNSPGVVVEESWIDFSSSDCPVKRSGSRYVLNTMSRFGESEQQPMVEISWYGADAYCAWLRQQDPTHRYRLPTEAEWEYMARGGTTSAFWFGDVCNGEQANVDGKYPYGTTRKGPYLQATSAVGSYAANSFGLYDVVGNVWEWCSDGRRSYSSAAVTDPIGPSGSSRVLRGGSWNNSPYNARSADRYLNTPDYRSDHYGFRVVCD